MDGLTLNTEIVLNIYLQILWAAILICINLGLWTSFVRAK